STSGISVISSPSKSDEFMQVPTSALATWPPQAAIEAVTPPAPTTARAVRAIRAVFMMLPKSHDGTVLPFSASQYRARRRYRMRDAAGRTPHVIRPTGPGGGPGRSLRPVHGGSTLPGRLRRRQLRPEPGEVA